MGCAPQSPGSHWQAALGRDLSVLCTVLSRGYLVPCLPGNILHPRQSTHICLSPASGLASTSPVKKVMFPVPGSGQGSRAGLREAAEAPWEWVWEGTIAPALGRAL